MDAGSWTGTVAHQPATHEAVGRGAAIAVDLPLPGGEVVRGSAGPHHRGHRRDRPAGTAGAGSRWRPTATSFGSSMAHYAGAPLDAFQRTVIDTASVSVVALERGGARVLLVNDTGGLDRFGPHGSPPPWEIHPLERGGASNEPESMSPMELGPVTRITADAVGEPGMRAFYLQADASGETHHDRRREATGAAPGGLDPGVARRPGAGDRPGSRRGRDGPARTGRAPLARGQALARLRPGSGAVPCWRSRSSNPRSTRTILRPAGGRAGVHHAARDPRADVRAVAPRRRRRRSEGVPPASTAGTPWTRKATRVPR